MMMMIPEAWRGPRRPARTTCKGFYEYHACLMEPWDGPASVAFTDGARDRRDARPQRPAPGRYYVTKDGWVVLGSEAGVLDEPAEQRRAQGPPAAGQLFLVDLEAGPDRRRRRDQARRSPTRKPYGEWLERGHRAPRRPAGRRRRAAARPRARCCARQHAFGYTHEDLRVLLGADGGRAARSRSARWATTRRSPCCRTASRRCSTTSSSCSRR